LGIGYSENDLKNQARRNDVTDVIKFVGVRANPYPYIKRADLFVIPSRFEGKSIALDEAKILCKPIVATKYPSVSDALEDGKNGVLVNMDARSIADGIQALYGDEAKRNALRGYLKNDNCSNEEEVVNKFMSLV
jgi:glycosyltransferase involved in cell wall biosynthesis